MSKSLLFLSGKRTPFGKNGGSLAEVNPTDLCVTAGQAALQQAQIDPQRIDHVILGNVLQSASDSIYTPRHMGLKCGIPKERPALGINRLCGSGFQVVVEAYHQMLAGDTQVALVGGVENMSMAPYVLRKARGGYRLGHGKVEDSLFTALTDSYVQSPMAITAENLAVQYKISREEADGFALRSQTLFEKARKEGKFEIELAQGKLATALDEHPRAGATIEDLQKLKPVFKKDGVVTAGNASGIVDGAAVMVVAEEKEAARLGAKPLGRLVSYGIVGCEPTVMGIGPAPASREALKRAGMSLHQMDLVEVNEAFAPQTLAVMKELEIDEKILNVNGGAIAVGHPLAASGMRLTLHMLYELQRRRKRFGLVTACIGGGQGIALVLEAFG